MPTPIQTLSLSIRKAAINAAEEILWKLSRYTDKAANIDPYYDYRYLAHNARRRLQNPGHANTEQGLDDSVTVDYTAALPEPTRTGALAVKIALLINDLRLHAATAYLHLDPVTHEEVSYYATLGIDLTPLLPGQAH